MSTLNYNHLRYFWAVAHDGNLTRTAERLNLTQSALSVQIRKLEQRLGHALFERRGRQLHLTEAGQIALDHADAIFATGEELLGTLRGSGVARQALRVGSLATLSRNFQMEFLPPKESAVIYNRNPRAGEKARYETSLNDKNTGVAYGRLAIVPGLSGNGKVVLVSGTTAEATVALTELILQPETIAELERRIGKKLDSSLDRLELLIDDTAAVTGGTE